MSEIPSRWSSPSNISEQSKSDRTEAAPAEPVLPPTVKLRPRACRFYLRRHVAADWSLIVASLLIKAKSGSVSHINLAAKLAGFDFRAEPQQKRKRREKSFAKQLLEEIDELEKKNIAEFGPL